jgi:rRNA maturation endonuclease Nob1
MSENKHEWEFECKECLSVIMENYNTTECPVCGACILDDDGTDDSPWHQVH